MTARLNAIIERADRVLEESEKAIKESDMLIAKSREIRKAICEKYNLDFEEQKRAVIYNGF